MKYLTTIDTKDYVMVVLRKDDKQDGEYTMVGNVFYKDNGTNLTVKAYPQVIKDGYQVLKDKADKRRDLFI